MDVHPDIAALRSDRAPQRRSQAAMAQALAAWRAEPGGAELAVELARFGKGAALEACPGLEAVFTEQGRAERLLGQLIRHFCPAMQAYPFAHPPFRNGFDGKASSILLARAGRAQLLLQAREPGDGSAVAFGFSDALRYDAVVAGEAEARIVRIVGRNGDCARFAEERFAFHGGERLALDLSSETLVVDRVTRRLVVLRLVRAAANPEPGREYDAATGKLLHQSAALISTSRQEAIITLLGRMGRTDAAPEIVRLALGTGDVSLRWLALREALALDTATGFRALCDLARRAADPLCAEAGALRAQLLESYPQLTPLETDICPA